MATPQMTKRFPRAESLTRAQELIERDDPLIYDVAASLGQQVANIRHMKSFVRLVAEWLEEKQRCKEIGRY